MNKERTTKESRKSWIIVAFTFSFMICVFAPLDAFWGNMEEYWFGITDIIPIILLVFIVSLVITISFSLLLSHTRASSSLFTLVTVFMLFFYVQGNFIPRNYGVLNGSEIEWNSTSYIGLRIASVVLAIICLSLFLLGIIKFRERIYSIGKYISLFILLIQIVTLGTQLIQKNLKSSDKSSHSIVVTDKDLLSFSNNGNNILVFVLDTFDKMYMDDLLAENPEKCNEVLENFTWYNNTLGAYPTTKGAIPNILTGIWYENDIPFNEYVKKAYNISEIYPAFSDNEYTLDVYTDNIYLNSQEGFYNNVFLSTYSVSDYLGFAASLYKQVAFNYFPHQLKAPFVVSSETFAKYKSTKMDFTAFSEATPTFYELLVNQGLNTEDRGNVFKFIHLDGVHAPFSFGEEVLTKKGESYTVRTEALGNLTLLQETFTQMKELGIYDNSTIIIMADHGHISYSQNPIFLIKNANEIHTFSVSDQKMSYEYLPKIFSELACGNTIDEEWIASQHPQYGKRRYLYYSWDNIWDKDYLPGMDEMFENEDKNGDENIVRSGRKYLPNENAKNYVIGESLSFRLGNVTAQPYCVYGFSWPQTEGTWSEGMESMMKMELKGEYNNIILSINAKPFYHTQHVKVFANNHEIGSFNVDEEDIYNLIIPNEYIEKNELNLRFQYDAPISCHTVLNGSDDDRMLAIFIKSITLNTTEQQYNIDLQQASLPKDDSTIFFYPSELSTKGKKNNGQIILLQGELQYGPYISLKPGTWKIRVEGKGLADASYYVTADCGKKKIAVNPATVEDNVIVYYVTTEEEMEWVEFLVGCPGEGPVYIDRVLLTESVSVLNNDQVFYITSLFTQGEKKEGRIIIFDNQLQYGPYISLKAGLWTVKVEGEGLSRAVYYVTANSGKNNIPIETISLDDKYIIYQFVLEEDMDNVEFLVLNKNDMPIYVDKIVLGK